MCALEWFYAICPIFTVSFFVIPQRFFPGVGIVTLIALVEFFPSVFHHVLLQVTMLRTGITTLIAIVGFFPSVFHHVLLQVGRPKRYITTLIAFIRFFSFGMLMNSQMAFQAISRFCHKRAFLAGIYHSLVNIFHVISHNMLPSR